MADDRSNTGSAATEDVVHDDDELAEVLAAELERYSTGSVPQLPGIAADRTQPVRQRAEPARQPAEPARQPAGPIQPLAVPQVRATVAPPSAGDAAFARRAAEVEQAMRPATGSHRLVDPEPAGETFRRAERPSGRRSATGPVMQPTPLPTAADLPVKRRTGFRPPPSATEPPPRVEPLDRVLPTGPISLPEPTASLLDAMITGSIPVVDTAPTRVARHAAPDADRATAGLPPVVQGTGPLDVPPGYYEDWEQSLRAIGRPRSWWEDEDVVPTGGNPDLPTVAVPIQSTGPVPSAPPESPRRGAHALPEVVAPPAEERRPERPRRGRRRATVTDDAVDEPPAPAAPPSVTVPLDAVRDPALELAEQAPQPEEGPVADGLFDADEEGIDEVAVDFPVVSAATTGAVDLRQVEPRPRTAPVLIEKVRTAILQLPSIPPSPTGSGAAAVVGRWVGAFASPLVLVLAFGLAAAGAGPAAVVAVIAGGLLAVPAVVRTAAWSAAAADDGAMQEVSVLGSSIGRVVAVVLLLARCGAAVTVLFAVGSAIGGWADRTGALGLSASSASLLGATAVALVALLCAALPTRATAVLTLLAAVLGAVGTLLIALVLAPNGGAPVATTASGAIAGGVAGFAGVGLLLVLCGADVARWRTDLANPVGAAVAGVVSAVCGAAILAGCTLIGARLVSGGDAFDGFAGALSDASASLLAGPVLVVLGAAAVTLPTLLLRSAGASAARLVGAGRPVRLGAVACGLLALAGTLALLAGGVDPTEEALAAAALCGVPVAVWAGLLATGSIVRKPVASGVVLALAVVVGWLRCDGLVPGATSPLLAALPASSGLRGGPAAGLLAALLLGVFAGLVGGAARIGGSSAQPADTVEG